MIPVVTRERPEREIGEEACAPGRLDRRTFIVMLAVAGVGVAVGQDGKKRTVAVLFDSLISPGWIESQRCMREEARIRGWELREAVSNMDDHKQYQQMQSMIQRAVDGIVIIHTDDNAVIPAIRAANRAGVPIVHFNRPPAPNDAYSVAVVAANRELMHQTVTTLAQQARALGGQYKAAILIGNLGDANAVQRRDGFLDAVAEHKDLIEVVAMIPTEWNADKAFAGLTNALQANPGINMLVTSSDFLTPQIEQALRAAGKWKKAGEPGHVMIAGFDGDENGYAQLAAGYYDVDGVQNLGYEVRLSFDAMEQMWRGEKPPKIIIDPGFVISRETLLEQRDEMWGYSIWKQKNGIGGTLGSAAGGEAGEVPAGVETPSRWSTAMAPIGIAAFLGAVFSMQSAGDVVLAMIPLAILVAGQMMVLLLGQIDLSMPAVLAMGSVTSASVMTRLSESWSPEGATVAGIATALAVGLVVGLFNGLSVAFCRIPSFIATLAMLMGASGATVWLASSISDTVSIGGLPSAFREIGYGSWGPVPIAFVLSAVVLLLGWIVLKKTLFGRWIYAIGHNRRAALIAGVPVRRVTISAFVLAGLSAGLASVILTSRVETGLPTLGHSMLLDIVGAAVIGGVSLYGGKGGILPAMLGVAFLCVLDKGLNLLGFSLFLVLAVKGLAILGATAVDSYRRKAA